MFIAAQFTIDKLWNQTRCLLTDKWKKIWHIYTMKYYSAMKKNEITLYTGTGDHLVKWDKTSHVFSHKQNIEIIIIIHKCKMGSVWE
jgi:hypothetical protein